MSVVDDAVADAPPNAHPSRRWLVMAAFAFIAAIFAYGVATSSPTVPLTLDREQAIALASLRATQNGRVVWTRVESKLVTYREWNQVMPLTLDGGDVDTTDGGALVWVVAYLGPDLAVSAFSCEWTLHAVSADARMPPDWTGSACGQGSWPALFDVLPDRAWLRLESLRGR